MRTLALLTALALVTVAATAEPMLTPGRIDAVTVYRGQALVTRVIDVAGPTGLREVVVTNLPPNIMPASIYAESDDALAVRSVRYRVQPIEEDVREEVRALDQQLKEVRDRLAAHDAHLANLAQQAAYLDSLEQFVAVTATVELTQGVLNAQTLRELTEFIFATRQKLVDQRLELQQQREDASADADLLTRKRGELTGSSSRVAREAIIFVDVGSDSGGTLRVRYLAGNATWSPSYNVRRDAGGDLVTVEYNASIQQMTGEDWNDVRMTLSTATPALAAMAPTLEPLVLTLRPPAEMQQALGGGDYQARRKSLESSKLDIDNRRAQLGNLSAQSQTEAVLGNALLERELNEVAGQIQVLELTTRGTVSGGRDRDGRREDAFDEGLSVTYELASTTTLPSRSDRQLVQIAAIPMQAEFYKTAIPVLTPYVYDEAQVVNTGNLVLLAGPVAAYAGGEFVGHGEMPTVSVGEDFTVGFGIDSSLRTRRELLSRSDRIQGGNRVVDLRYALVVENFGQEPAEVRLHDRLPHLPEHAVRLTPDTGDHALSDDPDYLRNQRPQGILRWDIAVPPTRADGETRIDYEVRLEYDKEMELMGLSTGAQ